MKSNKTIESYIKGFPRKTAEMLNTINKIVKKNAPKAEACISYGMPAYKLNGILIYFAGWENHVAIYPYPSAMEKFNSSLKNYKTSKSTIQFPLHEKLPVKLISDIVKFRVKEKLAKTKKK